MSQHQPSTPPRSDSASNAPRPTQSIAELYAAIAKSRGTQSPGAAGGAAAAAGARSPHSAAASPASPSPLAALIGPIAAAAAAAAASAASHSAAASSSSATAAASPAAAAARAPLSSSADRPPLHFSSVSHDEFSRGNKHNPWHSNSNAGPPAAAAAGGGGAAARTPARSTSAAASISSPRTASPTAPGAVAAAAAAARPSKPAASSAASAALSSSVFSTVGVYRSPLTSRPLVRTLVVALLALVGSRVKIDLRNESTVRGLLESVDRQGNMALVGASTQRPGEKPCSGGSKSAPPPPTLEFMFLPARSIRFVHIPASVGDAGALLTAYEQRLDSNLLEYQRKKRIGRYTSREAQLKNVAQKEAKLAREIAAEEAAASAAAAAANDPASLEARKEETRRKQRESMAGGSSSMWPLPVAATSATNPSTPATSVPSPAASSSPAPAPANQPEGDASNKRRKI